MPDIAIVIVTWNSARFIRDCLASIPQEYHPRTIVIDNNSRDDTAGILGREVPQARLVVNSENVGYASANNQGLRLLGIRDQGSGARADLPVCVLLLNPDTKLPEGGVEKMLAYMEANPTVGVLAPKLVNPDGSPQASCRRFPTYRNTLPELVGLKSDYRMPGFDFARSQEVEQPMASCLLFRREIFEQIGVFDEQFPMFFNDVDLSKRIFAAGWKTVYYPEVAVRHHLGGSTSQARPRMISAMYQSLFRYFRKYDRSGWFWLKAAPLALAIEFVAFIRIIAWNLGAKR